ncbi:amino acid adenylation domain-containing protein, partial [Aldersonia kunmingensis]|uniref:amino acid adenylation domain-containing protein n=1 Tax=Aldersonia kunmingensis TaxID=408066 RepID=UPI003CCBF208
MVAAVFAEITGAQRIGRNDDFFALGGNSLSASRMASTLRERIGVTVAIRALFDAPTVAGFAAVLADAQRDARPALEARPRPDRIPLSLAQSRMWFLNRFDPESAAYNIPIVIRLEGDLDVAALRAAIGDVVARHESLRTVFPEDAAGPVQVVLTPQQAGFDLPVTEVAAHEVSAQLAQVLGAGFDLTQSIPIRGALLHTGEDWVLAVVVHHISADGVSTTPLAHDVMRAYAARARGEVPNWAPLPVQYADYTLWQHQVLGDETDPESLAATQLAFWRDRLAGAPEVIELPLDRPRPPVASQRGSTITTSVDTDVMDRVRAMAADHGVSIFMATHTAFAVLLSRLGAGNDVVVGTPVADRSHPALDDLIGMFVNTVVLRTHIDPTATFTDTLAAVRDIDLDAFAHTDIPFERLVETLAPARSQAHSPLFQVTFAYDHAQANTLELPDLAATLEPFETGVAKSDLTLRLTETDDTTGLTAALTFATDLFDEATARDLLNRYLRLLDKLTTNPAMPVGAIDLLTVGERARLVPVHGPAGMPTATWPDIIAAAVATAPDRAAVVWEGRETSYRDFDARANRLARFLLSHGVGAETRVAVAVPRSAESVLAVWAVTKTGAAFVPIDPDYPAERIGHMLTDSGAVLGLTTSGARTALPTGNIPWFNLDTLDTDTLHGRALSSAPITDADRTEPLRLEHQAYVIYTSGSTGRPKGVVVSHTGLANLAEERRVRYHITDTSRFLHNATPSFDMAVGEQISALSTAATLVITPQGLAGTELTDFLVTHRVTHALITPALLATVEHADLPDLVVLGVGGEAVPTALVDRWAPGRQMRNGYGPTEATDISTTADLVAGQPITIGSLMFGMTGLVLDERLRPVPVGVPGELYLGGPALARGYHHQPGLSSVRFVANSFGAPGERLYRTGDVVRWQYSANNTATDSSVAAPLVIQYLGRSDHQVKIRGNRVELGEINAAFTSHPAIRRAHTRTLTAPHGDTVLVTYVTPESGAQVDPIAVRAHAAEILPRQILPNVVVPVEEFPLTPSGKLNERALPEPEWAATEYIAPTSDDERYIAAVFAEITGSQRVGRDDDFFALGGNSLSATRVIGAIRRDHAVTLPVRTLFDNPTVAELAAAMAAAERVARPALQANPRPDRVPLSLAQSRMWFLNRFDPDSATYNIPIVIRFAGDLDIPALRAAITDVITRHEPLRTVYPDTDTGPIQVVLPVERVGIDLPVIDVAAEDVPARLVELLGAGMDVTASVPVRAELLYTGDEWVLAVVVHHISADGVSTAPLARDVVTAYSARRNGHAPDWAPLPVQYADYTLWQREILGDESDPHSLAARQIDYWHDQLAGAPEVIELPADRPRPAVASYRGATVKAPVDPSLIDRVRSLAADHGVSVFMATHAAFAVLLSRMGAGTDVVVGTPVAGRGDPALEALVGMFVNTLVLRTHIDPAATFIETLAAVRDVDLDAFAHTEIPFERLVEAIDPARSQAHSPLFQVAFAYDHAQANSLELPDLSVTVAEFETGTAQFELTLRLTESNKSSDVVATLNFATDLFEHETARSLLDRYLTLLDDLTRDPGTRIGELDLLTGAERTVLVPATGGTGPAPILLPEILAAGVAANPDGVALAAGERTVSYRELDACSNRLARILLAHGAGPETFVAVAFPRSIEAIVAVWAIAKTGGAFVPIDPTHPAERIIHMLTDSGAALGLTLAGVRDGLPGTDTTWLCLDTPDSPSITGAPLTSTDLPRPLRAEHPAYVIYTSGSTGLPKGVMVTHTGLGSFTATGRPELGITAASRMLRFSSASFDASVFEMVQAFSAGATMVIADPEIYGGTELTELMQAERVTHTIGAPAVLGTVDADQLTTLESVVVGGDVCSPDLVARFGAVARFHNSYGPT